MPVCPAWCITVSVHIATTLVGICGLLFADQGKSPLSDSDKFIVVQPQIAAISTATAADVLTPIPGSTGS